MEDAGIVKLRRELQFKQFQFSTIYEFSSTIYSEFHVEHIMRVFFSTLMGQFGLSRVLYFDSEHKLFEKRGFHISEKERKGFGKKLGKLGSDWFYLKVGELAEEHRALRELLLDKGMYYLVNVSGSPKKKKVLGLGLKFNRTEFTQDNIEFAYFISRFSLVAIDNAFLVNRLIESKRMEYEMKVARDIQLSLLPQSVPGMENFEIGVIYEPIREVGGDYYDILKKRNGHLPILVADVEGKGLSAALLAASSQAIFRALNELYFFSVEKFIARANTMICDFTHGNRFITLFLMLLDDDRREVTYVNAGHATPFLISGNKVEKLEKGGFLTGFIEDSVYEKETRSLLPGDVIVVFTDGVMEVENPAGEEFGEERMIAYIKKNKRLAAQDLATGALKRLKEFSQGKKFRDDCTLVILKAK